MLRDTTFNDLSRTDAAAEAEFVMQEDAFLGFYERNARGLWAYLARITGNYEEADDLLQETFYRFLRAATKYEDESHRRNSLYRIATNLVQDLRRCNRRRGTQVLEGEGMDRLSTGDPTGCSERSADLTRAMETMNPRERAMLWLAYAEGASHNEIAGKMGIRPASLKPMLFRARRKIAALLGQTQKGGAQ